MRFISAAVYPLQKNASQTNASHAQIQCSVHMINREIAALNYYGNPKAATLSAESRTVTVLFFPSSPPHLKQGFTPTAVTTGRKSH